MTALFAGLFFGIFIGVHYAANHYVFSQRMEERLLKIPGIKGVDLADDQVTLTVTGSANLKDIFQAAEKETGSYEIKIRDNPSPVLVQVADASDSAIQEAAVRGNFTAMEAVIQKKAADRDISAKVYVDKKRIYLALYQGKKSLYRIVERPNSLQALPSS